MSHSFSRIIRQALQGIGPCLLLGVAIACTICLFILFSYILLWGILIGIMLWLIALVRRSFFSKKAPFKHQPGRVIDHEKNR